VIAMNDYHHRSTSINVASAIPNLIYIEVFPLHLDDDNNNQQHNVIQPELISSSVKIQLIKQTISSVLDGCNNQLHFRPITDNKTTENNNLKKSCDIPVLQSVDIISISPEGTENSIIYFHQTNIILPQHLWPCRCR
jgi:hypothetical protein